MESLENEIPTIQPLGRVRFTVCASCEVSFCSQVKLGLEFVENLQPLTQSREKQAATPIMPGNYSLNDMHVHVSPASGAHRNDGVYSAFTGRHVGDGWKSNESDVTHILHYFQNYITPMFSQEHHSSDRIAISAAAYSERDCRDGNLNAAIRMSSHETSAVEAVLAEGTASVQA